MSGHNKTAGEIKSISQIYANPSAIGLLGLALVTLVASSQKLHFTEGTSLIFPWAIFLGGAAQIYAGSVDSKLNNVFGATAFFGYGLFWFAVGTTWLIQLGIFGESMKVATDLKQLGFAYVGYLIFTIIMTIGSMETNKVLFIIFVLIDLLFIGLSLTTFGIATEFSAKLAGYSELAIAIASFYGCGANVLNSHFEREFLPVGKPFKIFKK